ncbi:hypothetical protein EXE46_11305 [Halorubrum sp. GN11_10-6_MGM]|uniref:hypothetical protein n=1 Tax=Halorubrum sp. GN11_10-6_MGM TaxID=2518112 RepID=UPI0010F9FA71|nr:hypothetical protein [Halorubrum sp. GN11_10-6_MGM]TKX74010.1 hypothetical protein EXE46_11305 [Halorubrum sp. GN11_10-6_MGM]
MAHTDTEQPPALRTRSVVGLAVCLVTALAGIFVIPTLEGRAGFGPTFWGMAAMELLAMVGVAYFVLNLHEEPT